MAFLDDDDLEAIPMPRSVLEDRRLSLDAIGLCVIFELIQTATDYQSLTSLVNSYLPPGQSLAVAEVEMLTKELISTGYTTESLGFLDSSSEIRFEFLQMDDE